MDVDKQDTEEEDVKETGSEAKQSCKKTLDSFFSTGDCFRFGKTIFLHVLREIITKVC